MNFEAMQKRWQSQDAGVKVTIDADVLLKEVRRKRRRVHEIKVRRPVGLNGLDLIFVFTSAS
jgi:hypothetical protein